MRSPRTYPASRPSLTRSRNNKFDVDASFSVLPRTSHQGRLRPDAGEKTYLVYRKLTDNTLRASLDTVGNQYITLRALVERTSGAGRLPPQKR